MNRRIKINICRFAVGMILVVFLTIYISVDTALPMAFKPGLLFSTALFTLFYTLSFVYDTLGAGKNRLFRVLFFILPIMWAAAFLVLYFFSEAALGF